MQCPVLKALTMATGGQRFCYVQQVDGGFVAKYLDADATAKARPVFI